MRAENTEKVLERLREELAWARGKAAKWQARVVELERQIQEKENLLILRAVRSVAASPEELRGLLDQIKGVHGPSIVLSAAEPVPNAGQEPPDVPDAEIDSPKLQDTEPDQTDAPETGQNVTAETAPEEEMEEQRDED